MRKITSIIALASLLLGSAAFANNEFPGRAKYKKIPYIELEDLYNKINDVVVVDARSKLEFDTLRIKTAVNIPVAAESFEAEIVKLRATTNKPIVFYCNGHTCMKSYISAKKAMAVNVNDVHAFDAGIFDWTKAYPDEAVLLGNSPVNLAHLIPKSTFKKRLLSPDDFSDRATIDRHKYMIIDVRDKFQRAGVATSKKHSSKIVRCLFMTKSANRYAGCNMRWKKQVPKNTISWKKGLKVITKNSSPWVTSRPAA